MKLYYSPRSPFVRKVMVFAHETGLAQKIELVRSVVAMTKPNAALMQDNPDGLDLATPSIAFRVDDLAATRAALVAKGVQATELGEHSGIASFAFPDNEGRWFAVIAA